MQKKSWLQLGVWSGWLLGMLALGGIAYAAPQDITMSPTSVSQVIQPGATFSGNFLVVNQGKSGYNFQVYASPYHVSGEDYTPDFTPITNAPQVADWFKFATTSGYIDAGATKSVGYTITVPKGTPPGGYYAVAFAETKFPQTGNSITLNERVGEIFYLQAAGPVEQKGQVVGWESKFLQSPPLTSTLRIEDSGGINFPANITVKVEDVLGQPKYTLETIKQILPQTIRRVTVPWSGTPKFGLFKVTGQVSFYGQTHVLATKWVLVMAPEVRLIVGGIFGLLVILLIASFVFRRKKRE
jgi:hypothetical protein